MALTEEQMRGFMPDELTKINIVLTKRPPELLYVCDAKLRPELAAALRSIFHQDNNTSDYFLKMYAEHLQYAKSIEEKYYEAGFSADFSEMLFIYQCESIDECRKLTEEDPLYKQGMVYEESYFEYSIHSPYYKAEGPRHPGKVTDVLLECTTPKTLIAGIAEADFDALMEDKANNNRPLFDLLHVYNRYGEGGTGTLGIDWAVGAATDFSKSLHILNMPTIEQAKMFNELDALCRWGVVSNFRYFEWQIHYPFKKVTPGIRKVLYAEAEKAGVAVQ